MKKLKVYIAGKVSTNSVFGTHDWRDGFCEELAAKSGFEIVNLDPTKTNGDIELAQNNPWLIFGRNSYMQSVADLVIVYLSDDISVGGSQEMLIAKYLNKPLLGIAPKEGKFNKAKKEMLGKVWENYIDPYVFIACDDIATDLDEAAKFIKEYFSGNRPLRQAKTLSVITEAIEYYKEKYYPQDSFMHFEN